MVAPDSAGNAPLSTPTTAFSRWEFVLLALALCVGAWARFSGIRDVGLTHFDEGIYALSGWWPWTGAFMPEQAFFSPPGLPILIGMGNMLTGGPRDYMGAVVAAGFSSFAILVSWWLARQWWRPSVGVMAAWLVAIDPMQIGFGRIGLTDAPFACMALLSFGLTRQAIPRPNRWLLLGAGLAVGFTWNLKYSGFLPLVWSLFTWVFRRPWLRAGCRWGVVAALGLACYLPWLFHVERTHTYATLLRHHGGYSQGWTAVPANLQRVWILWSKEFFTLVMSLVLLIAAAIGILSSNDRVAHAGALLTALLLPALYTPYYRLWLPAETLLLVYAAGGIVTLVTPSSRTWRYHQGIVIGLLMLLGLYESWGRISSTLSPMPRQDYQTAVQNLREGLTELGSTHPPKMLVRPPLLYYWSLQGLPMARLSGGQSELFQLLPGEVLVVDPAVDDAPAFASALKLQIAKGQLLLVKEYPLQLPRLAVVDDLHDFSTPVISVRVFQARKVEPKPSPGD